jgi:rare lipoprotein A
MGVNPAKPITIQPELKKKVRVPIPLEGKDAFSSLLTSRIKETGVAQAPEKAKAIEYEVRPGDSLWKIGVRLFHKDPQQIALDNGLTNPDLIRPGQKLLIYLEQKYEPTEARPAEKVTASWYGMEHQNKITAGGLPFDAQQSTVAHRTLPLGTKVRLVNPENGRTAIGRVADRGPYIRGRDLDVSLALAKKLGFVRKGVTELEIQVIS